MARLHRYEAAGAIYHVMARGEGGTCKKGHTFSQGKPPSPAPTSANSTRSLVSSTPTSLPEAFLLSLPTPSPSKQENSYFGKSKDVSRPLSHSASRAP
ncbi:hypothetical protein [Haloferula sp.]|uniref:hypothetical protein n=1 Tax=Haloferula sp. TaxID=2497595 RepID=UPI003C73EE19